jgi:hypothetical protein
MSGDYYPPDDDDWDDGDASCAAVGNEDDERRQAWRDSSHLVRGAIQRQATRAVLVRFDATLYASKDVWLPLSQVSLVVAEHGTVWIPGWLIDAHSLWDLEVKP